MGRGKACYIFKIQTNFSTNDLKDRIEQIIVSNKINERTERIKQRGFINLNVDEPELGDKRSKNYFLYKTPNRLHAHYREFNEKRVEYSDEKIPIVKDIPIIFDRNKKSFLIFSSSIADIHKIIHLFKIAFPGDSKPDPIGFKEPSYSNDENFFRWLVDNEKNHREKFPPSCKLRIVIGGGIENLAQSEKHYTSERARLNSTEHLSDDNVYQYLDGEGDIYYIEATFVHSKMPLKTYVHSNGKINITARPPDIDDDVYFGIFSIIFEEMENLYNAYLEDIRGGKQ